MPKLLGKNLLRERTISKYLPTEHLLISKRKVKPLLFLCGSGNHVNQLSKLTSPVMGPADILCALIPALRTRQHPSRGTPHVAPLMWHPSRGIPAPNADTESTRDKTVRHSNPSKKVNIMKGKTGRELSQIKEDLRDGTSNHSTSFCVRCWIRRNNKCYKRQNLNMDHVLDNSVYQ